MGAKRTAIIGSVLVISFMAGSWIVQAAMPAGAEELPPIYVQVADHEARIGSLESRADSTEAQVARNTSDIASGSQSKTQATQSAGARTVQSTNTQPATVTESSAPSAPVVTVDPRTIVDVRDDLDVNQNGSGARYCTYTLQSGQVVGPVTLPVSASCQPKGEVLAGS